MSCYKNNCDCIMIDGLIWIVRTLFLYLLVFIVKMYKELETQSKWLHGGYEIEWERVYEKLNRHAPSITIIKKYTESIVHSEPSKLRDLYRAEIIPKIKETESKYNGNKEKFSKEGGYDEYKKLSLIFIEKI